MTALLIDFAKTLLATSRDVLPVIVLITFFQLIVLRRPIPHLRRLVVGGVFVVIGLALFLAGLEKALFPLGKIMAAQLSDPASFTVRKMPFSGQTGRPTAGSIFLEL